MYDLKKKLRALLYILLRPGKNQSIKAAFCYTKGFEVSEGVSPEPLHQYREPGGS
jgi:hypothetical protein